MDTTPRTSRRQAIASAALASAALWTGCATRSDAAAAAPTTPPARPAAADPWRGFKAGVASYSLRRLSREDVIKGIRRLGLRYVSVKEFHLPLDSMSEERRAVGREFRDAGIGPISCGVITMQNDEAEVRRAFEYARDLGSPTIVCNPHPESMPLLDRMVKEFDIRLAIHNHGPRDRRWPSPLDAVRAAADFDPRIGVCVDVGHTARAGVDPADAVLKCRDRLYDVHLKDVVSEGPGDGTEPFGGETEIGRGVLNTRAILQALLDVGFAHHLGFEHEKDAEDPLPGIAESVGYVKGVLSAMNA